MIFFGSSEYSLPILKSLLKSGLEPLVVTVPDRPQGRGMQIKPNSLAKFAASQRLDIAKPPSLKKERLSSAIRKKLTAHKFGICAVYGKIIPKWILCQLSQGILNLHPSLLPRYRGAAPALGMILNNEKLGGFTIIKMDTKLDHGPIIYQESWPLPAQQTAGEYYRQAFQQMARKIAYLIKEYQQNRLQPQPQNHSRASLTPLLQRQDGYLPPSFFRSALQNKAIPFEKLPPVAQKLLPKRRFYHAAKVAFGLYRGLSPWPGVWTEIKKGNRLVRLKILAAELTPHGFLPSRAQLAGKTPQPWPAAARELLQEAIRRSNQAQLPL